MDHGQRVIFRVGEQHAQVAVKCLSSACLFDHLQVSCDKGSTFNQLPDFQAVILPAAVKGKLISFLRCAPLCYVSTYIWTILLCTVARLFFKEFSQKSHPSYISFFSSQKKSDPSTVILDLPKGNMCISSIKRCNVKSRRSSTISDYDPKSDAFIHSKHKICSIATPFLLRATWRDTP